MRLSWERGMRFQDLEQGPERFSLEPGFEEVDQVVTEDLQIIKEIFQIVEAGIVHGYDSFHYQVELGEGYMETEICVEKGGVESWSAEVDFDAWKIYLLAKQLKESSVERGEPWKSFILSYREGEQVRTKFSY